MSNHLWGVGASFAIYVTHNLEVLFATVPKVRLLYWCTCPSLVIMSTVPTHRFLLREEKSDILCQKNALWQACAYSRRSPFKESFNEDAVGMIRFDDETAVFAVADGCGGMRGGEQASEIALQALTESIERNESGPDRLWVAILDGIEQANMAVQELKIGAACTIAVVEYHRGTIRPYHVGDSMILVTGNRGRIRYQTVSHSPVGFAVESGMLAADEAMHHEDRHIVSNVVGDARMRIEMGPAVRLSRRDTVVIASDGLFDNLSIDEVVSGMRKGKLSHALASVTDLAYKRMLGIEGKPCKPDDLSVIGVRPVSFCLTDRSASPNDSLAEGR